MDWEILRTVLVGVGIPVILWYAGVLERRGVGQAVKMESITRDVADFKLVVARDYATKQDLKNAVDRIEDQLERVNDKLDRLLERQ